MRSTKLRKCENCLPDIKGAYFEQSFDDTFTLWGWRCVNCGHWVPAGAPKSRAGFTAAQKDQIRKLYRIYDRVRVQRASTGVAIVLAGYGNLYVIGRRGAIKKEAS